MSQSLRQVRGIDQAPVDATSLLVSVDAILQSAHAQSRLSGSGMRGLRLYRLNTTAAKYVLELDFQTAVVYEPQSRCIEVYPDLTGVSRRYPKRSIEMILNKPSSLARQRLSGTHGIDLSPSDQQMLFWLSRGLSNGEIGSRCGFSGATVKNHLTMLYKRLKVANRAEAITALHDLGLLAGCERHALDHVAAHVA